MIEPVICLLRAYNAYSETILKKLTHLISFKKFSPKELVLREGDVCRYIYFIVKGGLRSYVLKEEKEITIWCMFENDTAAAAGSFFFQTPSREYIEALEDTEVICISYDDLWLVCDAFPEFKDMVLKLVVKYYGMFYDRSVDLVVATKEERYHDLLEKQPNVAQRVPLTLIKSYLGMSQSSLTRIRDKRKD